MTQYSFKDLKKRAEDVYKRYEAHFAGKPRATRDPALLDELIGELDDVVDDAKESLDDGRDPAMVSLLDTAKQNLRTYREERDRVAEARRQGPKSKEGSRLVTEANLTYGRYRRHFAGENRATRDPGLLTELIVELDRIESEIKRSDDTLESELEGVSRNLEMYRNEYRAIEEAQESGSPDEQADLLATLANNQFAIYQNHFAGKPRTTRRPGLLERVVSQLKRIHKRMHGLKDGGLGSQSNERNMRTVSQKLEVYESELQAIRDARDSISTRELAGGLGAQANEIMDEYREDFAGESRATRDLEQLSLICDRAAEIASQMRAIQRDEPLDMNAKNLEIVLDSWTMYESEYRKVEEVQRGD